MGCFQPEMVPALVAVDDFRELDPYHIAGYLTFPGFESIINIVFAGKFKAQPPIVGIIYSFPETLMILDQKIVSSLPSANIRYMYQAFILAMH